MNLWSRPDRRRGGLCGEGALRGKISGVSTLVVEKPFPEVEEVLGRWREVSLESFPVGCLGHVSFPPKSCGARINGWLGAGGGRRGTSPLV